MITVYTAIIGPNTDDLHEPEPQALGNHRFVCFTDRPYLPVTSLWDIRYVQPWGEPAKQAKTYKIMPHLVLPDATRSLWLDASFTLTMDPYLLVQKFDHPEVLMFKHPDRTNVRDEGAEIVRLGYANKYWIDRQLARFETWPEEQEVLSACGLIFRDHTPQVRSWCATWLHEFYEGMHTRDQMSVDYAADAWGIEITHIPDSYRRNPYVKRQKRTVK
jgi:hypothetical protein